MEASINIHLRDVVESASSVRYRLTLPVAHAQAAASTQTPHFVNIRCITGSCADSAIYASAEHVGCSTCSDAWTGNWVVSAPPNAELSHVFELTLDLMNGEEPVPAGEVALSIQVVGVAQLGRLWGTPDAGGAEFRVIGSVSPVEVWETPAA